MRLVIDSEPAPISADSDGVYRVGGTRVSLDTVVAAFNDGATPEEIIEQYPSLALDHAYAVIGYYLRRKPEVDAYLSARGDSAAQVKARVEQAHSPQGIRDRLMSRRSSTR